jgi:hypothetical protein
MVNFDWENQTPFTMSKSPEQKIMELSQSKTRETEVFWNDNAVADKKSNHFDMMIITERKNIKLTYENSPPDNRPFYKKNNKQ